MARIKAHRDAEEVSRKLGLGPGNEFFSTWDWVTQIITESNR